MKLHSDGTIEGSPQEVLEYLKLKYPAVTLKCEDEPKQARGIQSPLTLNYISTKYLTEALSARKGVRKYDVSPEGDMVIREGETGCVITGPAIVLVNED
ncbi:BC1881 family protein [Paenibacillus polymyxa]|uniref:BC1881 family protein n=1 Tax=Paenibacillus polymyxa TaxID=1406 RepID=UPI00158070A8|nr:BC1881 family protein [Paenibacillus polymyxa]MBY0020736.1 BC1881 family protein [Paenibacillus polymyxa]MBY0059040.1 BC1881 family protein [Paenibacillus polymyxa]MBY0069627.1 BC1881 family protein [Paenibacillus polymyxa]MBY0078869.1 BC1881 family protein [Paenibacillus polymyxa]MBZ6441857.1 BC1881 family protein [Paenibacillus polymyxa]